MHNKVPRVDLLIQRHRRGSMEEDAIREGSLSVIYSIVLKGL